MREKRLILFEITVGGFFLFLSLLTMIMNAASPVARALRNGQRVNGILIGSDYEDNARHSDTLMFVSYDPTNRFLDVLSIPRDTMVSLPNLPRIKRINEVFAYEFRRSGKNFASASLAVKGVVETMLSSGTAQAVEIPYFFTVDYESFRSFIDALGGLYIKVTEPMNYDDNWGHLHIHFQPGTYCMNGHSALLYVRYRGANADQGRVLRQQLFVKEIIKRFKNPILLWRLPESSLQLLSLLHTNFSTWDLVTLLIEGRHLKWSNVRLMSLPGTPLGNLWKMNPEHTHRLMTLIFSSSPSGVIPVEGPAAAPAKEVHGPATVEVWNASVHPNAARYVMQLLRDKGFDVVRFGNYSTRQQRTLVLDRSGRLRPAQAVAQVLRAANPEVVSRIDPSLQADVSVILGNDFPLQDDRTLHWP